MFIQDETNKKTIIFVIRRFDDDSHDKDKIIEKIQNKLNAQTSNDWTGTNTLKFKIWWYWIYLIRNLILI